MARSQNQRYGRRFANHDATDPHAHHAPIMDHPLVCADHTWIDSDAGLAEAIAHIRAAGRCVYDTEFIGELSYYPQLCLIQLGTTDRVYIVDTLAKIDVTPVWEMLADPDILKIVHAGGQDLEPVVRHLGRGAENVYDTQVAAGFAHLSYPISLANLIQTLLGIKLGKAMTFTRWDQRPLSPAHIRYAADDVRYGMALYDVLTQRLAEGRDPWIRQRCAESFDPALHGFEPIRQMGRVRGAKGVKGRDQRVLLELVTWRDTGAREADKPPRSFLKDELLVELAKKSPREADKLDRITHLPAPIKHRHTDAILQAIERGREAPPLYLPEPPEETPEQKFEVDTAWAAMQARSRLMGVDPTLVGSRLDVAELAAALRDNRHPDSSLCTGWRGELLEGWLASFLRGETRRVSPDDQD